MLRKRLILVVDDEEDLLELVEYNLRMHGFDTATAARGSEALEIVRSSRPDLVILDLMLPDMPGTEVCRRIRADAATRDLPVVMLTARGEEIDRVVGFEVGADDYVVKSDFSVRELVLRVRAVLRRRASTATVQAEHLHHGALTIDEGAHRVWLEGEEISLTAIEFRLLWALVSQPGRVQSRSRLLREVWGGASGPSSRTVDTHVRRLRSKLGAFADYVDTVRGVGYRFDVTRG